MQLFIAIVRFFPVLIFFMTFVSLKWAIALYIFFSFLVPVVSLPILPFSLLTLVMVLRIVYEIISRKKNPDFRPLIPYAFLMTFQLLMIPFQSNGMPQSLQFSSWRIELLTGMFVPVILWWVVSSDRSSSRLISGLFCVMIAVTGLYGLFLTQTVGVNPYITLVNLIEGRTDFMENWLSAEDRLFGRSSSMFDHPMRWGLFLDMSLCFLLAVKNRLKKWLFGFLIALVLINIVVCGVRTSLATAMAVIAYYMFRNMSFRTILYAFISFALVLLIVYSNDNLLNYVASIFDLSGKKTDVNGSSLDMRLSQLNAVFSVIRDHEMLGNGYGWVSYYLSVYGNHPVLYAFESLLYVILCQSGFIGLFLWIIFGVFSLAVPRMVLTNKKKCIVTDCIFFAYIIYCLLTGDYAYMRMYYVFYVSIIGIYYIEEKNRKEKVLFLLSVINKKIRRYGMEASSDSVLSSSVPSVQGK